MYLNTLRGAITFLVIILGIVLVIRRGEFSFQVHKTTSGSQNLGSDPPQKAHSSSPSLTTKFSHFLTETILEWHKPFHCKKHAITRIISTEVVGVTSEKTTSTNSIPSAKPSFVPRMPIPASCFQHNDQADQRLIENWRRSYNILLQHAPPDVLRYAPNDIDDMLSSGTVQRWLSRDYSSFSSGYTYIYPLSSSYLRIYKAANNAIRYNLNAVYGSRASKDYFPRSASKVNQSKCIFTFVRDPVQHFLSGYNEYEYRANMKEFQCADCLYESFPKGSEERFWAFLLDLLSFKFLRCFPTGGCHIVNGQLRHVYPMSSILKSYSRVDFVGSIENMGEEWQRLERDCLKIEDEECKLNVLDDSLGQHESSSDTYGIYEAAKNAVKHSQHAQDILKAILEEDYRCFGGEV